MAEEEALKLFTPQLSEELGLKLAIQDLNTLYLPCEAFTGRLQVYRVLCELESYIIRVVRNPDVISVTVFTDRLYLVTQITELEIQGLAIFSGTLQVLANLSDLTLQLALEQLGVVDG